MNQHEIIFSFDSSEKIILSFEDDLTEIDHCYDLPIILDTGLQKIILANVFLYYAMEKFSNHLKQALNNELIIHKSITKDIGYLYNEYSYHRLQDMSRFIEIIADNKSFWAGYKYYLWSSCLDNSSYATWLYNNNDGFIIFEVTPLYVPIDSENEDEQYVSYKKWIKNYTPYLIKKISKKIALKWLNQAHCILQQIDSNTIRWEQKQKNS